jgi:hypothetical protein
MQHLRLKLQGQKFEFRSQEDQVVCETVEKLIQEKIDALSPAKPGSLSPVQTALLVAVDLAKDCVKLSEQFEKFREEVLSRLLPLEAEVDGLVREKPEA